MARCQLTTLQNANPGGNFTVNNYVSGSIFCYTSWSYNLYTGICCSVRQSMPGAGTGNTGTVTITPSATSIAPIVLRPARTAPLCAGDPHYWMLRRQPSTPTFSNTAPVLISSGPLTGTVVAGVASPYPSNITVSGLPTSGVTVTSVTLNNLSHTWAGDLDILLQSPTGQNVILLSDNGGSSDFINSTLVFSDAAVGLVPNNKTRYHPVFYRPTNTAGPDNFPAPGPGSITNVNPTLSTFTLTSTVSGNCL